MSAKKSIQDNPKFIRYQRGHWNKFIKQLLSQIKQGESFSLIGMPGIGKTDLFQTFDRNRDFWQELNPDEDIDFLFIFTDLTKLLAITPLSFYRLLLSNIHRNVHENIHDSKIIKRIDTIYKETIHTKDLFIVFGGVEDILKAVTEDLGLRVCILIDDFSNLAEFDRQFFNTLKALRNINKWKIILGFSSDRDIETTLDPERLDELWDLSLNKVYYLKPLSKTDALYVMQEWRDLRNIAVPENAKSIIYEISGGHVGYMRALYRVLTDANNDISIFDDVKLVAQKNVIRSRSEKFWTKLLPQYREFLIEFVQRPHINFNGRGKYLQEIGVINEQNAIFSPLLQYFVEDKIPVDEGTQKVPERGIYINQKTKTVYAEGKRLHDEPTKSEYKILRLLYKNKGELVSREDIAQAIWGPNFIKKYSDWAIDRTISRLRKKIGDSAKNSKYIETVKGRGLRLVM